MGTFFSLQLFKIVSKNDVLIANYPFATIDPNVGVVPVPDARVDTSSTSFLRHRARHEHCTHMTRWKQLR